MIDGAALTASVKKGALEGSLAVRVREEKLPPPGRRMVGGEAKPSELWAWFPPDATRSARRVFVHIVAETAQHAGHADILRETLDGQKTMG